MAVLAQVDFCTIGLQTTKLVAFSLHHNMMRSVYVFECARMYVQRNSTRTTRVRVCIYFMTCAAITVYYNNILNIRKCANFICWSVYGSLRFMLLAVLYSVELAVFEEKHTHIKKRMM